MRYAPRTLEIPGNLLLAGEYAITLEGHTGITFAAGPPVRVYIEQANRFELCGRFGTSRGEPEVSPRDGNSRRTAAVDPPHPRGGGRDQGPAAPTGTADADPSFPRSPIFNAALELFADESRFAEIASRAGSNAPAKATTRRPAFDTARKATTGSGASDTARKAPARRGAYDADDRFTDDRLPPVSITVDSASLYTPEGRKLGFGSSAAATVGTVAALLAAIDIDPVEERRFTALLATVAHRDSQGGAGSGYDVATSCYGGVGLFTGGEWPTYRRLDPTWLPRLGVRSGEFAESTSGAIRRFRAALGDDSVNIEALLSESDRAVGLFADARNWNEGRSALEHARHVGVELGKAIGVPAGVFPEDVYGDHPGPCGDRFMKALGAGRETIGLLPYLSDCGDTDVPCDMEGLRWA